MSKPRIAILRGGPSDEYSVSMKTGGAVLRSLQSQNYSTKDIVVTKAGEWIEEGKVKPEEIALEGVDMAFIAMHGRYAEDGEIQKIFQRKHLPYTGSSSLSSAIAFNKKLTKEILKTHGILVPQDYLLSRDNLNKLEEEISIIEDNFGPEYIIKPVANGSSIGARLVRQGESLKEVAKKMLSEYETLLVEEFIRGREATGAVIENFRNEDLYSFPTVEIIPPREYPFFTNEAKYSGKTELICPSRFSYQERNAIAEISTTVHKLLDLSQYSRSDFIIRDGKIYFLEVNTLPGLTPESIFPKAAEAVGLSFDQLIQHLINTTK